MSGYVLLTDDRTRLTGLDHRAMRDFAVIGVVALE
jgi:hypothetical protein